MEPLDELNLLYVSQLSLLTNAKRMHRYLVNHNLLDKESDRLFREILKMGKADLWKSYMCLKKSYRNEEKYKMFLRHNT